MSTIVQTMRTLHKVLILITVLLFGVVLALNDANDLVLTAAEKNALDQLRPQVIGSLPESFMKTDFYLIRWIRVANLDVGKARSLLMQTVYWRRANNISNILNEDWSDMELDYGMGFEGLDREGRPIMSIEIGDWDIRAAALQGKTPRLIRYLTYSNERGMQRILEEQKKGNPATRFLVLVDAENLNLRQHLCPSCMSVIIQWATGGELNYPRFSDEVIVVNAPSIITFAMNALRPVMSQSTRDQMKIFSTNKREWQAYLNKRVEKSQLKQRYGGTMS